MDAKLREIERAYQANTQDQELKAKYIRLVLRGGPCLISVAHIEAELCRASFYDFVKRFWHTVIQEKPVWNWHIRELCEALQEAAERVFRGEKKKHDILINIPPGTTKSTICSVMFPVWVWTRMPSARTICASYAQDLAFDLSRKSRMVAQSDKFKELYPDIEWSQDQNAKGHWANTHGGERIAVGVGGNITGKHAHFIIIDDPINPKAADSEAELETANRYVTETLPTRKVDKKISVTMLIMQRLHQNDPSAILLDRAEKSKGSKIKHFNLPGEIPPGKKATDVVRPRRLAKYYKRKKYKGSERHLLDPVRMPISVLETLRAELGEYGYASQILQMPAPPGGGMFKVHRITIDTPPPLRHFKKLVRYWDKAGTKDGGAFTVGALLGRDAKDRYWILDVVRGQWDSATREEIIKQTAFLDSSKLSGNKRKVEIGIEQEPGSGGKESAENTAKNLAGFKVTLDKPTGSKESRADVFSVQVNAGNVFMVEAPWNNEFIEEHKYFPKSTYKDQVDAASGAFKILSAWRPRAGGLY